MPANPLQPPQPGGIPVIIGKPSVVKRRIFLKTVVRFVFQQGDTLHGSFVWRKRHRIISQINASLRYSVAVL
jgi:hypothetical protein